MFNTKLRKNAIDNYNATVERYEKVANSLGNKTDELFNVRTQTLELLKQVEERINQLANTPKEFNATVEKIDIEISNFNSKREAIKKAEVEAKVAEGSSGTAATLSTLGLAVATMGPTAAMGIATTFGVASTGTAISALSGAAATNAALAWIGGGALVAGGAGKAGGVALLGLAGPVGWTIAGVMLTASVGSGLYASHKNKQTANELIAERENLEIVIRKFNTLTAEVDSLIEITNSQIEGVANSNKALAGLDYDLFTRDEKLQAGQLVNSTLTLAQLINKELKLDD